MQNEDPRAPHASRNTPAEEEARLLRMASEQVPVSHDSRSAYGRATHAKLTGESCGRCGRAIGPDEPLYRAQEHVAHGQMVSTNLCRDCAPPHARVPGEYVFEDGYALPINEREPCEVCGRPVVWLYRPHWRRYSCCSVRCSRRRYNRARDEASAHAREKVCEVCGSEFFATRSDAKTCSPSCRQKSYRRRSQSL